MSRQVRYEDEDGPARGRRPPPEGRPVHIYRVRRRRFGAVLVLLAGFLAAAVLALVASGDDEEKVAGGRTAAATQSGQARTQPRPRRSAAPPPVRRVETLIVGSGAEAATIVRPAASDEPNPAVILLHGWGLGPVNYGAWARHLAFRRNTVILPEYQVASVTPPSAALESALAGVRTALESVPVARDKLVVVGHSAGAELAADYAAVAKERGVPAPLAVFAVYPGAAIRGYPAGIPRSDLKSIPGGTSLVVLAGASDTVVGPGPARQMYAEPTQLEPRLRRLELVRTPGAADHFAPTRADAPARAAFWRPLDRLIADVRR